MNDNTPQEPMTLREWLAKLPPQAMELRVDAVTVLVGCIKPCGDHYHLENVRVISPCEAPTVKAMMEMAVEAFDLYFERRKP